MNELKLNFQSGFNIQDIYQPNLRSVFEYKKFSLNLSHKISSNNYDAVLNYHLNSNQLLKMGCEYQEETPNFYLQFINALQINDQYSFHNDNTLSTHIIRNNFKLKK